MRFRIVEFNDVENREKIYSPTTANITQLKNAEGAGAELDYLEKELLFQSHVHQV